MLVDVDGHRLHIWCTGSGTPSVILGTGLGDSSADWGFVQLRSLDSRGSAHTIEREWVTAIRDRRPVRRAASRTSSPNCSTDAALAGP
jgi:hypothetical protein